MSTDALIKTAAKTILALREQVSDINDEIKGELAAAKSSGIDIKALNKVIKEMAMDNEGREKQLSFEWEVDAYRAIVGLPTEMSGVKSGDKAKATVAGASATQ